MLLRFLQVEARTVEVARGGDRFEAVPAFTFERTTYLTFDEAVERELLVNVGAAGPRGERRELRVDGGRDVEYVRDRDGAAVARMVRERWPLRARCSSTSSRYRTAAIRGWRSCVRVENHSTVVPGERSAALRTSLVSTNVLLAIEGGRFLSVLDPPPFAVEASGALANHQTFPVLIGDARADAQRGGTGVVVADHLVRFSTARSADGSRRIRRNRDRRVAHALGAQSVRCRTRRSARHRSAGRRDRRTRPALRPRLSGTPAPRRPAAAR